MSGCNRHWEAPPGHWVHRTGPEEDVRASAADGGHGTCTPRSQPSCDAKPARPPAPPQVLGTRLRHALLGGKGHFPRAAPAPGPRGTRLCAQVSRQGLGNWLGRVGASQVLRPSGAHSCTRGTARGLCSRAAAPGLPWSAPVAGLPRSRCWRAAQSSPPPGGTTATAHPFPRVLTPPPPSHTHPPTHSAAPRERPSLVGKSSTKQTAQQKRKAQHTQQGQQKRPAGGAGAQQHTAQPRGKKKPRMAGKQLMSGGGMYNLA